MIGKFVQLHKSIAVNETFSESFQVDLMSDHLRPPLTSSTGRLQPIARPDWPWAARTYSQRSPQNTPFPSSSVLGSNLQSGWDPRASVASNSSQREYSGTNSGRSNSTPLHSTMRSSGGSTRQWTFMVQSSFNFQPSSIHEPYLLSSGI